MQFNFRYFKILQLEKLALFNLAYFCHPPIKPKFPSLQNYTIYVTLSLSAILSDDEGEAGGATGEEQPVLPELSEDENEEAARQSGRRVSILYIGLYWGGGEGGATGEEQPVLPELSEDENEEAARQSGRE